MAAASMIGDADDAVEFAEVTADATTGTNDHNNELRADSLSEFAKMAVAEHEMTWFDGD